MRICSDKAEDTCTAIKFSAHKNIGCRNFHYTFGESLFRLCYYYLFSLPRSARLLERDSWSDVWLFFYFFFF